MTHMEKLYMWLIVLPFISFILGNMWDRVGIGYKKEEEIKNDKH